MKFSPVFCRTAVQLMTSVGSQGNQLFFAKEEEMRKYVLIGLGGALGAILRVAFRNIDIAGYAGSMPVSTLLINICGSFLLALFLTAAYEHPNWHPDIRLGIATGFIGAFTTFSTMCKEIALLIYSANYLLAASYALLSLSLGLTAAALGVQLARKINAKRKGGTKPL